MYSASDFGFVSSCELCADLGAVAIGVVGYGCLNRDVLDDWLGAGNHAGLEYMAEHRREDPRVVLSCCQSLVVVLFGQQKWSYHSYIRRRLRRLGGLLSGVFGDGFEWRGVVDTAPVLERQWAVEAGLGVFGRSSMLLREDCGSDFNIGILLTSAPVEQLRWMECGVVRGAENPVVPRDLCDGCSRCVDACPGDAILANRTVDCRKCKSHLRQLAAQKAQQQSHKRDFESRLESQHADLRQSQKGCLVCQAVCPYNAGRFSTASE